MLSLNTAVHGATVPASDLGFPRPNNFHEQYLAVRPAPYYNHSSFQPTSSGGVLPSGQAVWFEHPIERKKLSASVEGFVENIGFVSIDPRLIKRGEGSIAL